MNARVEGSKVAISYYSQIVTLILCINITGQTRRYSSIQFWCLFQVHKPILMLQDNDKAGVSLHNGLWAPLFALGAGTSMYVNKKIV